MYFCISATALLTYCLLTYCFIMWHIVSTPFPTNGTVPVVYELWYRLIPTYALALYTLFTYLLTVYLLSVLQASRTGFVVVGKKFKSSAPRTLKSKM